MGLRAIINIINVLLFQWRDRLQTSESDVRRRQILTSEDGPSAERVNKLTYIKLLLAVNNFKWLKVPHICII